MTDPLLAAAVDLTASLTASDRYQRLVLALPRVVPADAAVLLRVEGESLRILASVGLVPEALGRRLKTSEHPRLAAILGSEAPLRFPSADPRPDPWDGMLAVGSDHDWRVHSCMGCALRIDGETVGVLTVDAARPDAFERVEGPVLARFATFAALAAAAMRTASLIEALEDRAERRKLLSAKLQEDVFTREGGEILGASPAIRSLLDDLGRVAGSDLSVLLLGETGVGKELAARTLHARSRRSDAPLVYVNCAALPESVAESEIFGHTKGAFTGAISDRMGPFELANGGTLFLDEVGELPLTIQPKLLRALQEGEVQRVGSERLLTVDVRLIAATNRDLAEEVRLGRFRPDLYHRLAVYPIRVPPLRERGDDVLLLAGWFLDRARVRLGTGPLRLDEEARRALRAYPWPGNVRELEHVLLRAAIRATGGKRSSLTTVRREFLDLPGGAPIPTEPAVSRETVPSPNDLSLAAATDEFQRRLIAEALRLHGGNWSKTARHLGLDRGNFHRLATRLGLGRNGAG